MRQRKRYLQALRLGCQIPSTYRPVKSVVYLPNVIQDTLLKYPEAMEDSTFKSDEVVRKRYKHEPLKYIISDDDVTLNKIKTNKGHECIIQTLREQKGEINFKKMLAEIKQKSAS